MSLPSSIEGRECNICALETLRPDPKPNIHVQQFIVRSLQELVDRPKAHIGAIDVGSTETGETDSRSELDSHANMVVVGKHAFILQTSTRMAEVNPFSTECGTLEKVPIVDAIVAYDCPYSMKTYLLVVLNALYIPSMEHNLVVPFIMREAGIVVNDVPKIQVKNPTEKDHSIWFPNEECSDPFVTMGYILIFSDAKANQCRSRRGQRRTCLDP